jgi:transposase
MLTPTGWYLATAPVDLRCGMDRLLVLVQSLAGNAVPGDAYVFRNRNGTRIKVLIADATGVWLCTRRLNTGRFVWPRAGDAVFGVSMQQFEWLCAGVDWQRLSASKPLARIV